MDQITSKLTNMHKALYLRDDVDRLYLSRNEEGSGLTSIEDSVDASIQQLEDYTEKHEGELITDNRNDTDNTVINGKTINRKEKLAVKQFYGYFKRLINSISPQKKTWIGLKKGNLTRETESLLIAAQSNAIRTNQIIARIDKTQQNCKCRFCGIRNETITYIISVFSKLAQTEYKTRHGWVSKMIHWEVCKKIKLDHRKNWYI